MHLRRVDYPGVALDCRFTVERKVVLATGLEQATYIPVDLAGRKFEKLQIIGGNYAGTGIDPRLGSSNL